ncbi:fumarylacetoacetate hydrolase family protein [Inquilinus limosus]|uniref:2-keto-4-pentenoate hydratase n=1 Tax=Inquilinus limosus TaxID=171674 RepID=UPI003F178FE9
MNSSRDLAIAFTEARRAGRALPDYPGTLPPDLPTAYAVQEEAIGLWTDTLVGWKVAGIADTWRPRYDAPRLAGPVFARNLHDARGGPVETPVIPGGFGAVEAEFVLRIGRDIPAEARPRTIEEVRSYIDSIHAGMEIAGSPLATLNDLGPGAVASDFGNNAGLVIGPAITDWDSRPLSDWTVRTRVDGGVVGEGSAARVAGGGPIASLAFLAEHLGRRGRALPAGSWVLTGMTTGVHKVVPGQRAQAEFDGVGTVEVLVTAAGG